MAKRMAKGKCLQSQYALYARKYTRRVGIGVVGAKVGQVATAGWIDLKKEAKEQVT
jgi:hypothetical protein